MDNQTFGHIESVVYNPKQASRCPQCMELMLLVRAGSEHSCKTEQECPRCGSTILYLPGYVEKRYTPEIPDKKYKPCQWCGSNRWTNGICENGHKRPGWSRIHGRK